MTFMMELIFCFYVAMHLFALFAVWKVLHHIPGQKGKNKQWEQTKTNSYVFNQQGHTHTHTHNRNINNKQNWKYTMYIGYKYG